MIKRDLRRWNTGQKAEGTGKILSEKEFNEAPTLDAILRVRRKKKNSPLGMEKGETSIKSEEKSEEKPTLLTIKQVCRLFNVTPMTIYHWVKSKEFPKIKLSGGKNPPARYDEKAVKEWSMERGQPLIHDDYLDF